MGTKCRSYDETCDCEACLEDRAAESGISADARALLYYASVDAGDPLNAANLEYFLARVIGAG